LILNPGINKRTDMSRSRKTKVIGSRDLWGKRGAPNGYHMRDKYSRKLMTRKVRRQKWQKLRRFPDIYSYLGTSKGRFCNVWRANGGSFGV